jgi:hypothetical protein
LARLRVSGDREVITHLLGWFSSPERRHPMINGEGREMVLQAMMAILSLWFTAMGLRLIGRWL